jgi:predicted nucleic acid-binding protein
MVPAYLETSALLAAVLEQDATLSDAVLGGARFVVSELTLLEARRALVRLRAMGTVSTADVERLRSRLEQVALRCDVIRMHPSVLARCVQPFPVEPVRTLDAIHLATLELLASEWADVRVSTRDRRVATNAEALGLTVV